MCGSCAMTVNGARAGPAARTSPRWPAAGASRSRRLPTCRSCATSSPTCASSSTSGRGPEDSSRRRATRHDDFARVAPDVAGAPRSRCGDRMHRLRRLLRVVRRRRVESGLSRSGGAQPRLDARQRRARRRATSSGWRAVAGDAGCHACHTQASVHRALSEAALADGVDRGAEARDGARGAQGRAVSARGRDAPVAGAAGERGGARAVRRSSIWRR